MVFDTLIATIAIIQLPGKLASNEFKKKNGSQACFIKLIEITVIFKSLCYLVVFL